MNAVDIRDPRLTHTLPGARNYRKEGVKTIRAQRQPLYASLRHPFRRKETRCFDRFLRSLLPAVASAKCGNFNSLPLPPPCRACLVCLRGAWDEIIKFLYMSELCAWADYRSKFIRSSTFLHRPIYGWFCVRYSEVQQQQGEIKLVLSNLKHFPFLSSTKYNGWTYKVMVSSGNM